MSEAINAPFQLPLDEGRITATWFADTAIWVCGYRHAIDTKNDVELLENQKISLNNNFANANLLEPNPEIFEFNDWDLESENLRQSSEIIGKCLLRVSASIVPYVDLDLCDPNADLQVRPPTPAEFERYYIELDLKKGAKAIKQTFGASIL